MEHTPHQDDIEPDEDDASGMPEGEPELNPMGVDEDLEDAPESGEKAMPGIPVEGEPDVSG